MTSKTHRLKTKRVHEAEGILINVSVGVHNTIETNRVTLNVSSRRRFIVAIDVVVKAAIDIDIDIDIEVLTRKSRSVRSDANDQRHDVSRYGGP